MAQSVAEPGPVPSGILSAGAQEAGRVWFPVPGTMQALLPPPQHLVTDAFPGHTRLME